MNKSMKAANRDTSSVLWEGLVQYVGLSQQGKGIVGLLQSYRF